MSSRHDDFEPGLPPHEREMLSRLAAELQASRPLPSPHFRGTLRQDLLPTGQRGAYARSWNPRRLAIASCSTGAALLLVAGAGLVDVGPLAPRAAELVAWLTGPLAFLVT